ncbi:hypothetical protein K432DRAFT_427829 [Lepidopterella palustris CBS 459.81]|uniref:Uncharacterized protein n=1 Tax=Lepidopterella palustris CBS 459.81 TaxID=1314670 RepID=A0A8E2JCN9_9PEZI|nr:hypothetical protein K432DRAFT_427829 [Lepidopterella palustris CBS 459.81]
MAPTRRVQDALARVANAGRAGPVVTVFPAAGQKNVPFTVEEDDLILRLKAYVPWTTVKLAFPERSSPGTLQVRCARGLTATSAALRDVHEYRRQLGIEAGDQPPANTFYTRANGVHVCTPGSNVAQPLYIGQSPAPTSAPGQIGAMAIVNPSITFAVPPPATPIPPPAPAAAPALPLVSNRPRTRSGRGTFNGAPPTTAPPPLLPPLAPPVTSSGPPRRSSRFRKSTTTTTAPAPPRSARRPAPAPAAPARAPPSASVLPSASTAPTLRMSPKTQEPEDDSWETLAEPEWTDKSDPLCRRRPSQHAFLSAPPKNPVDYRGSAIALSHTEPVPDYPIEISSCRDDGTPALYPTLPPPSPSYFFRRPGASLRITHPLRRTAACVASFGVVPAVAGIGDGELMASPLAKFLELPRGSRSGPAEILKTPTDKWHLQPYHVRFDCAANAGGIKHWKWAARRTEALSNGTWTVNPASDYVYRGEPAPREAGRRKRKAVALEAPGEGMEENWKRLRGGAVPALFADAGMPALFFAPPEGCEVQFNEATRCLRLKRKKEGEDVDGWFVTEGEHTEHEMDIDEDFIVERFIERMRSERK